MSRNAITDAYLTAVADGRMPVDELAKAVQSSGLNEAYYSNGHLLRPLFLSRPERNGSTPT
jgi:hypothetical protein